MKKRKAVDLAKAKAAAHRIADKKRNKAKRQDIFLRAEKYVREYRKVRAGHSMQLNEYAHVFHVSVACLQKERSLVNFRREAKKIGKFYKDPEAKIAVVVRIRGINGVSPKVKKILQLLRLRQIHNAVFVRLNSAVQKMLTLVTPYIAYGCVNPTSCPCVHSRHLCAFAFVSCTESTRFAMHVFGCHA